MDDGEGPQRGGKAHARAEDEPDGMPGSEDGFHALAEDWIAIWQSEITAYLTDPETQQAWSAMMAIWAGAAQSMIRGIPVAKHAYERPGGQRRSARPAPQPPAADAAAGSAPAPAPPVARDDEIRRLEQRVAELERSLAEQDRRRGVAGDHRRARRPGRPRG